jgi:hypothetical protein
MALEDKSLDEIIAGCKQANSDFHRGRPHDARYCFELFRRALALRNPLALEAVWEIYFPQLRRWVLNHPYFDPKLESEDFFALGAFTQFHRYLVGEQFAGFKSVPRIMRYMKDCVHTAVAQYVRDHGNKDVPLGDLEFVDPAITPQERLHAVALWELICKILKSDQQRKLAYLVFDLDMKPAQIVAEFPGEWSNERSVSITLHRIRKRLRSHPAIRNWMKSGGE